MPYSSEVLPTNDPSNKQSSFNRFLNTVEWLGNLLPHPVTLFAIFALGVVLFSGLASLLGLSVIDPRPIGTPGRAADGVIQVVNLLNGDGLRMIVTSLVSNFTNFAPLGTVLVAILGVGISEHSGLLSAVVRSIVMKSSKNTVTLVVVFAGVISNTASELGYVVLIPLSAIVFYSLGRHPIAGLAAAFAGVSGGYSANLLIGTVDPLLAGITQTAARIIDPLYEVGPEMNWYFMVLSTFMIAGIGSWVTIRFVEPNLGTYDPNEASIDLSEEKLEKITAIEKRGLFLSGLSVLVVLGLFALTIVPEWGVLRNPETGLVAGSPFLKGIVAMILVFFAVPGIVYGKVVGTIKNDRDIINCMAKSMSSMGLYIVLVFFAAQFVAFFKMTNFGTIFAILGADFLQHIGLTGPFLFVIFIVMCGFVNLMIGSASAQWAVTAPIFVPMLMLVGYSPEVIQAAYRIGDSVTNIITPMMSYFGLIVSFATRYKKDLGIGTIIATMLPYSIFFLVGWALLFFVWVFVLNMPVGPGASTYYPAVN